MFATSVGLLMNALEEAIPETANEDHSEDRQEEESIKATKVVSQQRKSILDRFGEKLKEFLDNA